MNTTTPVASFTGRSIVIASAWYDLIVTVAFATPWTAKLFLASLATMHAGLGIGGAQLPAFETMHLFFIGLLGSTVTMWSVIRILRPSAFFGRADGFNRLAFSSWMVWALAHGASHILGVFLLVEFSWGVVQLTRVSEAPVASRMVANL